MSIPPYVEITDQKGFIRDTASKAVINVNQTEYNIRKETRERRLKEQKDFQQMKSDIGEMKAMLERLLNAK